MDRPRHPSRTFRRLAGRLALAGCAAGAVPLLASAQDAAPARGVAAERGEARVSMRFFNAPWPTVLREVAEQTGSNLVLKDVPPGRFSRFDKSEYTRAEAVKLLNRRLEPDGYRVLEQGPNLIVLSDRSVRQNYRRPVAPDAAGRPLHDPATAITPLSPVAPRRRSFASVLPARDPAVTPAGRTARAAADRYAAERAAVEGPAYAGPGRVRTADGAVPTGDRATALFDLVDDAVPAADALAAADAAPERTVTVRVGRGRAKEVARTLLQAVGPRAKLVDSGPSGLPAFSAYRPDPAQPGGRPDMTGAPAFSVGVDEARDELVVTAPGERAERVADALRSIDRGAAPGAELKVVAGGAKKTAVAKQLGPVLARLATFRRQQGQPPQIDPGGGRPDRGDQPRGGEGNRGEQPQGEGPQAAPPQSVEQIIENLRGDVQVEEFGDSGVLLFRGNRDDLDAILRVVEQLEQLSAGLQPQIQLLVLRHVDSIPLAALLTEVYGELARLRNRGEEAPNRVTVLPVGKPNAIVVIASETDLDAVEALATQLDQPVPAGSQLEVFPLEHAAAAQVAAAITSFYEGREGLFPQVRVFADVRTNTLIVNAAPNGLAEVAKLVRDLDRGESGLVTRLEVVALEFATAELLADTINQAIQSVIDPSQRSQQGGGGAGGGGGGGNADLEALQAARSVIVEYVTATGEVGRSGLLADVAVAADVTGNRLILTAPEKTMPLLVALVAALDAPGGARADVKVFTLENADAETAVEVLRELFTPDDGPGGEGPAGVTLEGTADAGSALVPLRFSADSRTQTVLAIGGEDALAIVEAVLLRLDDDNRNKQQFFSVKLLNTPAINVAQSVNELILQRRTLLTQVPGFLATGELIERDAVVIPEISSNRLLVYASDRSRDELLRLIREIDEAPPQVAISALIVEVDLTNTDEFGIELGFQDSILFDRSTTSDAETQTITETSTAPNGVQTTTERIINQTGTPGFNFNNTSIPLGGNLAAAPGTVATQVLNNFGFGRANAELGFGGFVFSASSANVSVLLRALAAKRTVHVLSRPQVTVLDQQPAELQVGQEVPVVSGVNITNNSTIPNVVRDQSGLILRVTPRISPDGTVFMAVGAERSNFDLAGVPIFTDVATGAVITSPIKNVTITNTFVSVPNGQTIVIGGIITSTEAVEERKVPYLGDIPYVGQLFRTDSTVNTRSELLIFLTPRIIYTDADFELIKQVEADRLHYIEHEAEAIHGPLFGVPPEPGTGGYEPALFRSGAGLNAPYPPAPHAAPAPFVGPGDPHAGRFGGADFQAPPSPENWAAPPPAAAPAPFDPFTP